MLTQVMGLYENSHLMMEEISLKQLKISVVEKTSVEFILSKSNNFCSKMLKAHQTLIEYQKRTNKKIRKLI